MVFLRIFCPLLLSARIALNPQGFLVLLSTQTVRVAAPTVESQLQREILVQTRRRRRAGVFPRGDLRCYSWSLSHLGYLYPETIPVVIKVDHK